MASLELVVIIVILLSKEPMYLSRENYTRIDDENYTRIDDGNYTRIDDGKVNNSSENGTIQAGTILPYLDQNELCPQWSYYNNGMCHSPTKQAFLLYNEPSL